MPRFSESSKNKLDTCHTKLQQLMHVVVYNYDCTVLVGHRTEEAQTKAFDEGNSKVQWPDSKHNSQPSLAVDVAPYPIIWDDKERFYHFAGYVLGVASSMDIKLRWGGDWDGDHDFKGQTFNDLVHFELVGVD